MPKGSATHLVLEPSNYGVGVTLFGINVERVHVQYTPEEAHMLANAWFNVSQLAYGAYHGFAPPRSTGQKASPFIGANSKEAGGYSFTYSVAGRSGGLFYRTACLSEEAFDKALKALRQERNVVTVVRLQT